MEFTQDIERTKQGILKAMDVSSRKYGSRDFTMSYTFLKDILVVEKVRASDLVNGLDGQAAMRTMENPFRSDEASIKRALQLLEEEKLIEFKQPRGKRHPNMQSWVLTEAGRNSAPSSLPQPERKEPLPPISVASDYEPPQQMVSWGDVKRTLEKQLDTGNANALLAELESMAQPALPLKKGLDATRKWVDTLTPDKDKRISKDLL